MRHAVGLALVGLLCFGINDLIFKRAAQHGVSSHNMMMTVSLTMFPLVLAYGMFSGKLAADLAALWGAVGGVFTFIGFYSFSRSLGSGAVSIAAPVFRLAFVVTSALAIAFLPERLTLLKAAGSGFAVVAAWLLLGGMGKAGTEISREGLGQVLFATLCVGVSFFFFKLGIVQGASPASVLLAQNIALTACATAASITIDKRFSASPAALRHGIPFGIIQAIGFGSVIEGLGSGEVSILYPIAQLSFLVTAFVGLLFLKEKVTPRKMAGLGAAIGAVAVLGLAAQQ